MSDVFVTRPARHRTRQRRRKCDQISEASQKLCVENWNPPFYRSSSSTLPSSAFCGPRAKDRPPRNHYPCLTRLAQTITTTVNEHSVFHFHQCGRISLPTTMSPRRVRSPVAPRLISPSVCTAKLWGTLLTIVTNIRMLSLVSHKTALLRRCFVNLAHKISNDSSAATCYRPSYCSPTPVQHVF